MKPVVLGLRGRLLLLVLLAVIPAFVLIGYTAYGQRQQAEAEVRDHALGIVHRAAMEQRRLISTTRQLLMSMAQLPAVRPGSDRVDMCSVILTRLRRPNPYYRNFGVATPDGEMFCSALPMHHRVNITDRGYFQRAMRSRDFGIGEYQIGRITNAPGLNFGYPVTDEDGKIISLVFAALNLEWLQELIAGVDLPHGASLMMIDSEGTVLAHYPQGQALAGDPVHREALLKLIRQQQSETVMSLNPEQGRSVLYAVVPLKYRTSGRVYLAAGIPSDVAFASANHYLYRSAGVLAAVMALVFIAAWFGSDILILRPIRALRNAAQRLAAGDMSARTGLPGDAQELGQLATSFDDMAGKLERTNRALRTLSAGNHAVVRATDEEGLLRAMCDNIVSFGGYRAAWVGYRDEEQVQPLHIRALAPMDDELPLISDPLALTDSDREDNPLFNVLRDGEAFVSRDLGADSRLAAWNSVAERYDIHAMVLLPLLVDHRIIGVLGICSADINAFDDTEIALLEEAAEDLAYGIRALRVLHAHEEAHATIAHMAYCDALTGLPNHSQFDERLQERIAAGEPVVLLLIDLDRFREVNEALGFKRGDLLLRDVGERIARALPEGALLARMRGNEFAVLLSADKAWKEQKCVQGIITALEDSFTVEDLTLDVSASIGITRYPEHGKEGSVLIQRAEAALRQARRHSESSAVYEPEDEEQGQRRLALATQLRHAIENDELVLYYQPKIDLQTQSLWGVEALLRWQHPEEGLIPPDQFIPLAEDTGLIKPLTDWVMHSAMCQSTRWRRHGLRLPVSVNLSARNLHDRHMLEKIEHMLYVCDTDVSLINLELTESAIMMNPQKSLETLQALRDRGFVLFIDDFGTGYSSLSYLQKMPVGAVKIDKSFVQAMLDSNDSLTIVSSTIAMAHDLGLTVVAEGVETREQWKRLQAFDCDVAQGYYISRPMPLAEFDAWLAHCPYTTDPLRD